MKPSNAARRVRMTALKMMAALTVAVGASANAVSEEQSSFPALTVVTDIAADSPGCKISTDSTVAAAKAALRYNRIDIATNETGRPQLYVIVTALPAGTNFCAVRVDISIRQYQLKPLEKFPNFNHAYAVELCAKGGLQTRHTPDLQNGVNGFIKDAVDECITEIDSE